TAQDAYPGLRPACGAAFSVEETTQERLILVQEVERTHMKHLNVAAAVKAIQESIVNEFGIQVSAVIFIKPASIPKTSSRKIQRHECRRKFLEGSLDVIEKAQAT